MEQVNSAQIQQSSDEEERIHENLRIMKDNKINM
jgi:hypothetical protein